MRASAEFDIGDLQGGELGRAQSGLRGEEDHRVVTPAGPGGPVGGGEQRVELEGGEPGHERAVVALQRNREDALDRDGVLGMLQRGVAVERADRGQPRVPGPWSAAAVVLEMIEKRADRVRVEIIKCELRCRLCRRAPAAKATSRRIVSR